MVIDKGSFSIIITTTGSSIIIIIIITTIIGGAIINRVEVWIIITTKEAGVICPLELGVKIIFIGTKFKKPIEQVWLNQRFHPTRTSTLNVIILIEDRIIIIILVARFPLEATQPKAEALVLKVLEVDPGKGVLVAIAIEIVVIVKVEVMKIVIIVIRKVVKVTLSMVSLKVWLCRNDRALRYIV